MPRSSWPRTASFETAALHAGALRQPVQLTIHRAANVAEISAPLPGTGSNAASVAALTELRQRLIPQTLGRVPGTQALTDGQLASSLHYNAALRSAPVRAFAFVMAAVFAVFGTLSMQDFKGARGRPRGRDPVGRDLDPGGAPAVGDGPAW